jgi:hypothetical protein
MAGLRTHIASAEALLARIGSEDGPEGEALRSILLAPGSPDALFSGSVFPDWGYRGVEDDASEAAHWKPFLDPLRRSIADGSYVISMMGFEARQRKRYAAFCLGTILHGALDEPWHFDDPPFKCFLTEAREREGLSHGKCERYCDLFLLGDRGMPPWEPWYPELLIMSVYSSIGYAIGAARLRLGHAKMAAELALYARLARRSSGRLKLRYPWTYAHFMGSEFGAAGYGLDFAMPALRAAALELSSPAGEEARHG